MTDTTHIRATLAALTIAAGLGLAPAAQAGTDAAQADALHVTLTPTCGCCGTWAELAEAHGFEVEITVTEDHDAMKAAGDVPDDL